MIFTKKKSLKKEYDLKLLAEMERMRIQWQEEKEILDRSYQYNEDLENQVKMAEIKYFYLFKEAKARNLRISTKVLK